MNVITGLFVFLAVTVVGNSTYEFNHKPVKKVINLPLVLNNDYLTDPNSSSRLYQLIYDAATWNDAKYFCARKHGKLATPKSMYEFKLVQQLVRGMRFQDIRGVTGTKTLAWVGISSLKDWTVWETVDGEDIRRTGFSVWLRGSGMISPMASDPHCAGIDAANALRDYWCDRKQPFVCEYNLPAEVFRIPE